VFDLGSSLRDARERKRLSFADLEQSTKVRAKYLRALEEDDFGTLPGPTYVKGFLRVYAEVLGLDGQLYVDEYNSRFVSGDEETIIRPRRTPPARPVRWIERNAVVVALAGIAVITAVVIGAWRFVPDRSGKPTVQPPGVPAQSRSTAKAAGSAKTLQLVLRAKANTWLEVHNESATGRLLFQGTLERGKTQRFDGARLWLNVGAPAKLAATVNGRKVTLPGSSAPKVMVATAAGVAPLVGG
jgi:cytoskeletal protein RodZ